MLLGEIGWLHNYRRSLSINWAAIIFAIAPLLVAQFKETTGPTEIATRWPCSFFSIQTTDVAGKR
ncbi:hypothetical protein [Leptolyngbya sp. Heron Island J]|uniref:hypothetical protein n=1 Tax=Leptolyngbya sp. Heron Island J TaxID=1385935 RepID=UPI0012696493|nr:hypothetical protein [Leptolyngbya sp. Heron Island J]